MLTLIGMTNKDLPGTLEYTHRPLPEQFAKLGMRQIEIDLFADPNGGLYANPRGRAVLASKKLPQGPDADPNGDMKNPGFKILHIQDIDYQTTVRTLQGALRQIHSWSARNPKHVPLFVLLELKDDAASPLLTTPVKFDAGQLDALDAEILSSF